MKLRALLIAIGFVTIAGQAAAQENPTPILDSYTHEGVISCYGSTCHSRQSATGNNVRQNEIITWQDQSDISGAHSRAYKVLLNQKSRIIARNLGIGPAHEAKECLACHSDYIPEEQRGERFDISEGVGCEACHGGSENWLTSHYAPGQTHEQNTTNGLYRTEDPVARAKLCLGCHLGSEAPNQFITHRIMGAGHPRISFELDLFTNLQSHHDEDTDYRTRKNAAGGVKTWAIGQAMALQRQLELFSDPVRGREGAFPELVFFDCHACHLTFSNDPDWRPTWRANPDRALGPGVPVFNDANLIMLKAAVKTVAPEMEDELRQAGIRFHRSVSSAGGGSYQSATGNLLGMAKNLSERMAAEEFSKSETLSIMKTIVNDNVTNRYTDYSAAEQAIIAVDTFLEALLAENHISYEAATNMRPSIDAAYDVVNEPNRYNQNRMRDAFKRIATQVNRL